VKALTEAKKKTKSKKTKTTEIRPFTPTDDYDNRCKIFSRSFTKMDLKNLVCEYEIRNCDFYSQTFTLKISLGLTFNLDLLRYFSHFSYSDLCTACLLNLEI